MGELTLCLDRMTFVSQRMCSTTKKIVNSFCGSFGLCRCGVGVGVYSVHLYSDLLRLLVIIFYIYSVQCILIMELELHCGLHDSHCAHFIYIMIHDTDLGYHFLF